MLCFKRKFSPPPKVSKLSLNLCFTADLHHLQDHFSNFLLNFSSLAKNAKREIWRQKGDLRCKICNCMKCLALHNTIKSPKNAAHAVAQSTYPIYRYGKACLSKQPPWRAAGNPCLARSRSRVRAPGPAGALHALFSPPSLPSSFGR